MISFYLLFIRTQNEKLIGFDLIETEKENCVHPVWGLSRTRAHWTLNIMNSLSRTQRTANREHTAAAGLEIRSTLSSLVRSLSLSYRYFDELYETRAWTSTHRINTKSTAYSPHSNKMLQNSTKHIHTSHTQTPTHSLRVFTVFVVVWHTERVFNSYSWFSFVMQFHQVNVYMCIRVLRSLLLLLWVILSFNRSSASFLFISQNFSKHFESKQSGLKNSFECQK